MRLIISTNSALVNVAAKNAITAFLEAKRWSVWHWYEDLWLIDNAPDQISVIDLRDEILRAIPTLRQVLIMTTEGRIGHAGTVPHGSSAWFTEHWSRKG